MTFSVQSGAIEALKPLWAAQDNYKKQTKADLEKMPVWQKVVYKVLKVAPVIGMVTFFALGITATVAATTSLIGISAVPLVIGAVAGLFAAIAAAGLRDNMKHQSINKSVLHTVLKKTKIVFGEETKKADEKKSKEADKKFPDESKLKESAQKLDDVITCLKQSDLKEHEALAKEYTSYFGDLPKEDAIKALRTASVVLHMLAAIQGIQYSKPKKAEDMSTTIKEHLTFAKAKLEESSLSAIVKLQIKNIANFLEKTPHVFTKEKYEPQLSDIDDMLAPAMLGVSNTESKKDKDEPQLAESDKLEPLKLEPAKLDLATVGASK